MYATEILLVLRRYFRTFLEIGGLFLGIDFSEGSDTFRRRQRDELCEKCIPAFKTEVQWAVGDSIPHWVPTWFLLGSYDSPRSCWDCSASAGRRGAQHRSQSASVPACLSFSEKQKNICYPAIYRRKITTLGGKTPWIPELEFFNNLWGLGTA